jgi:hypothetical protein
VKRTMPRKKIDAVVPQSSERTGKSHLLQERFLACLEYCLRGNHEKDTWHLAAVSIGGGPWK